MAVSPLPPSAGSTRFAIPDGTRAKTIEHWHGAGNIAVLVLFVVSWYLRRDAPDQPGTLAFVLALVAVALAGLTWWLGGKLVDRLGVGVDRGANSDAPSSLSGRSASE